MEINWHDNFAAIWRGQNRHLRPVVAIDQVSLEQLIGIDRQKQELVRNTRNFLAGRPANNALLWGARGTGKSALIKGVLNEFRNEGLRLIEVARNDLADLPLIVDEIRFLEQKFIIFCDDFSFEANENVYISLKTILDGSIELAPDNLILYATSNRRHLLPESRRDNLETRLVDDELHYSDSVEEKISLSDRFGLWLSFRTPSMNNYLKIIDSLFPDYDGERDQLHQAAREFAAERAAHNGRTARQFHNHFATCSPDNK